MKHFIENGILHMVFEKKEDMNKALRDISYKIEGNNQLYEGHNFPISSFTSFSYFFSFVPIFKLTHKNGKKNKNKEGREEIKYVIAYMNGDEVTKNHELYHAKYYMDKNHRENVKKIWEGLSEKKKDEITRSLNNMGYPSHLHIDEFQAYLFSEPLRKGKNFWNI